MRGIQIDRHGGPETWAEQVALPTGLLAKAPTTVPLADAAALPLAGLTAMQALDKAAVTSGTRLLIIGAAGAVGGIAVQLARRAGVAVDALVSRPEHREEARALGFDASGAEHERGAGLVDRSRAQGPQPSDESGKFGFDVDGDEAEEVDVPAMAGGDERQQLVGDLAALSAQFRDRDAVRVRAA
ncbi:hypothetical protein [Microtetraspora malaysiensis]|uniref:hypothetical protein n=1 Tax=Microtetraspora malaysiensis TaxID=161358 RepID=UPI003D8F971D